MAFAAGADTCFVVSAVSRTESLLFRSMASAFRRIIEAVATSRYFNPAPFSLIADIKSQYLMS